MESNPESAKIFLSQLRQSTTMIKTVAKRSSRAYKDIIEAVLTDGVAKGVFREMNTTHVASMLFGAYQMTVLEWVASDCTYPLGEKAKELSDFVLVGLACDVPAGGE